MTKRAARPGATCLMLLGGCDGGTPEQNNTSVAQENAATVPEQNTAASAQDYQAQLVAMPEGSRNGVFIRAIRDANRECQHVDRSAQLAPINGAPAWKAVCDGGLEWIIVLGEDGIAQVTNDAELRAAGATTNTSR